MPLHAIEYLNARKAAKAATGGAKQDHSVKYAEPDEFDRAIGKANAAIFEFAIWAEQSRQRYLAANGIPQQESCDDIPF